MNGTERERYNVAGPIKPDADGNFTAGIDGAVFAVQQDAADDWTAGGSTCPICMRVWVDSSAANPNRPCESCGMSHAWKCVR